MTYCNMEGIYAIIGMTYNPLTKHYKLASDVDVNYMIQTLREA